MHIYMHPAERVNYNLSLSNYSIKFLIVNSTINNNKHNNSIKYNKINTVIISII